MCLFVCFILHATAKESESDIFLKELAAALNQNSSETGMQAKYEKRCFYVLSKEDMEMPEHFTQEQFFANMWDFLDDGYVFKSMVFDIENDHPGFLQHLVSAKAKVSWTYNVPRLELERTILFSKEELRHMLMTSAAQREKLKEEVMIKAFNLMLPTPVDDGITLQSFNFTSQHIIWNFWVDETVKRLEEVANGSSSSITAAFLLEFCKDKENEFHKLIVESGVNIKVRFTEMPSRRYLDAEIPVALIKEIATNDNIKDAQSLSIYLELEKVKKQLPLRVNEQRAITDMRFSFDDNTQHCYIEESKAGVEHLLLLADQPDIQRWYIGYALIADAKEELKDVVEAGINYEYIVRGEGITDSLSIRFDNDLLKKMVNATQWERDSIEVALNVALMDAALKNKPKTGVAYVNSWKVEGQNVVKEIMVAKSTVYNNIKRYPMTLKREELEQSGMQAVVFSLLKKCKRNLTLRYVNKQNTKQSFDVPISYFEIE